ncbi:MAG: hypothetical protein EZS28_024789 [Streblomastix strix]|uniref:Uncharacterized protein n=1 Tax=Streblomastix strix TaxID=222440 RepID=A0A5J4VBD1_9EUKA|nr:MAG: hypothetical protein EZS28_024789 [Streblomastix strix]
MVFVTLPHIISNKISLHENNINEFRQIGIDRPNKAENEITNHKDILKLADETNVNITSNNKIVKILRTQWTNEDDLHLLNGILLHGFGNWEAISEYIGGGKTADHCEQRYYCVHFANDIYGFQDPFNDGSIILIEENENDSKYKDYENNINIHTTSALRCISQTDQIYIPLNDQQDYSNNIESFCVQQPYVRIPPPFDPH